MSVPDHGKDVKVPVEHIASNRAIETLSAAGAHRGSMVGLAVGADDSIGLAIGDRAFAVAGNGAMQLVGELDRGIRPRWVLWSNATAVTLVACDIRLATCWDLAAVHRLLFGGWSANHVQVWAAMRGLDERGAPMLGQLDLLSGDDGDDGDA
ncbi:MAG: hypothetical protein HY826_01510, partial [Actinobacteria bacterium]|nr:hypothetical protein [Actinomycetota bacterium]